MPTRRPVARIPWLPVVVALAPLAGGARAADVEVAGRKLVVVDKIANALQAKVVFVAKDQAVDKGTGTDPAAIEARLDVAYDGVRGAFTMPPGGGWVTNEAALARYQNPTAPTGGAVRVGVIKPGKLLKVVAPSLGDQVLDVTDAPQGAVYVAHTVTSGLETIRHCTRFEGCRHRTIVGGTGRKLVCRNGVGDPSCTAVPPSFPTCAGPALTDCGACASGCVVEHESAAFVCVDPTACDQASLGCTTNIDCALVGQACIDVPQILGATLCCNPCPAAPGAPGPAAPPPGWPARSTRQPPRQGCR